MGAVMFHTAGSDVVSGSCVHDMGEVFVALSMSLELSMSKLESLCYVSIA